MRTEANERHTQTFVAMPSSAQTARGFVTTAMTGAGAHALTIETAALVISELASNIIEHGDGGSFDVVIELLELDRWRVGVECALGAAGLQLPDPQVWSVASSDRPSGRGLGIVRALSDSVSVVAEHGRLSIGCVIASADPPPAQ